MEKQFAITVTILLTIELLSAFFAIPGIVGIKFLVKNSSAILELRIGGRA